MAPGGPSGRRLLGGACVALVLLAAAAAVTDVTDLRAAAAAAAPRPPPLRRPPAAPPPLAGTPPHARTPRAPAPVAGPMPHPRSRTSAPRAAPPTRWAITAAAAAGVLAILTAAALPILLLPSRRRPPVEAAWFMAALRDGVDNGMDAGAGPPAGPPLPHSPADIRWLPPLGPGEGEDPVPPAPGEVVVPLLPLQHAVHLPGTAHTLSVLEPRYCDMYSAIILNGSRRFVVPLLHPNPTGEAAAFPPAAAAAAAVSLSEVGVIFHVTELSKAEQAGDGVVRFVCQHTVGGRVRIRRVLNPHHVLDRKVYLRAVVEDLTDTDPLEDCTALEAAMSETFREVVALQQRLKAGELVRFGDGVEVRGNLGARGGGGDGERDGGGGGAGFWHTAALWQALLQERLGAFRDAKSAAEQALVQRHLQEQGIDLPGLLGKEEKAKVGVRLTDLPAELQRQYFHLQDEYDDEARPLTARLLWFFQGLIQERAHGRRVAMLDNVMHAELRRLRAKAALRDVFRGP